MSDTNRLQITGPVDGSLRDRIAKVLYERIGRDFGYGDAEWRNVDQSDFLADADAVIAELGLIRDPFSTVAFHRYVTQWAPNGPDWKAAK